MRSGDSLGKGEEYVGQESEARNEGASLKKLENWSKSGLIKSVNTTI